MRIGAMLCQSVVLWVLLLLSVTLEMGLCQRITHVTGDVDNNTAKTYLTQFGYMQKTFNPRTRALRQPDLPSAIREFQLFVGLPVTGVMDALTVDKMQAPRCGNKDIPIKVISRRRRRYAFNGSRWHRKTLTYQNNLEQTTYKLHAQTLMDTFRTAFSMWSSVANLQFVERANGQADIVLQFGRRDHGDSYPFDGRGKTLAHAFGPAYGGDVHFDDDEPWTIHYGSGRDLLVVAVHEIGHSLGLSHTRVRAAVMAPYYKDFRPGTFRLHQDDIQGIQALYGKAVSTTTTTTKTTTTGTLSSTIETTTTAKPITTLRQHFQTTYHARTSFPAWYPTWDSWRRTTRLSILCYWWDTSCWERRPPTTLPPWFTRPLITDKATRVPTTVSTTPTTPSTTPTTESTTPTTTKQSTTITPRNPNSDPQEECGLGDIDAIISPPGKYVYAFKGNQYIKLRAGEIEGSPTRVNTLFRGVNMVDAAMTGTYRQHRSFIYIFTRWMVRRFNLDMTQVGGYTTVWQEFPGVYEGSIDAAFQWSGNNRTYLFAGNHYYKLREDLRVEVGYPRPITVWGLPANTRRIGAATTLSVNRELYFFVGDQYYKYDAERGRLAVAHEGVTYPRSTAQWWFGCVPLQTHLSHGIE